MKSNNLKSSDLKKINRQNILRFAFKHDLVTKQDIALALKISQPTVATCLNDLVAQGLMKFEGTADSTGGRKAQYVTVDKESIISIGVSITKHHLRFIALNTLAQIKAYKEIRYEKSYIDKLNEYIRNELTKFIDENKLDKEKIIGVNLAIPGIVSYDKKVVEYSPVLNIKNIDFETLIDEIPYKSTVFNDADAGGFAEWWDSDRAENIVYLSVDRGVGGYVYLNGKPYLGNHGHSAEFGHMCIVPGGKQCSCKRHGCLEAYCSIGNLCDKYNGDLGQFFDNLKNGDKDCEQMLSDYLKYLALGIKNIYMVFDTKVILGGGLARYADSFEQGLSDLLKDSDILGSSEKIFKISRYGVKASCFGAAVDSIEKLIKEL